MKKLVFCLMALTPAFAFAAPGPYATVQAGVNWVQPNANFQNGATAATATSQNDAYGFVGGAAVGYLWGDNTINYGLEADGLVYPNTYSSSQHVGGSGGGTGNFQAKYDGYNLSLLAVLKYTSCSTGFTAFVKAGGAYVSQQLDILQNSVTVNTFTSTSNVEPEAAVGVGYMLASNLEVDVTADGVFAGSQNNINTAAVAANSPNTTENYNFLVGLTYHFG